MHHIYVLENSLGRWYIGQTNNLGYRFARHNNGEVKSTKNGRPWKIIYTEKFATRAEAMRREEFLKSGKGRNFLKTILQKDT